MVYSIIWIFFKKIVLPIFAIYFLNLIKICLQSLQLKIYSFMLFSAIKCWRPNWNCLGIVRSFGVFISLLWIFIVGGSFEPLVISYLVLLPQFLGHLMLSKCLVNERLCHISSDWLFFAELIKKKTFYYYNLFLEQIGHSV